MLSQEVGVAVAILALLGTMIQIANCGSKPRAGQLFAPASGRR